MRHFGQLPQRADQRLRHIGSRGGNAAGLRAAVFALGNGHVDRVLATRNVGEIFVHQTAQIGHVEIARHNQCGSVRPVIGLMKCPRIIQRGGIEILNAANARPAVREIVESNFGQHDTLEQAIRRRENAGAILLLHHVAFCFEHFVIHHRKRHPFAVSPEHPFKILRGDGLEIVGPVGAIRSVARPADVCGQIVDHVVGHIHRLPAQNMLEQMREPAATFRIELAADFIPQRCGDIRGRVILNSDDPQAVIKRPLGEFDFGRCKGWRGGTLLRKNGLGRSHCDDGYCGGEKAKCHGWVPLEI